MGATIRIESAAFREEFRKRVLRSMKSLGEVTNQVAYRILLEALKLTKKGDKGKIEALGITYRTMNKKGTRRLKHPKGIYNPTSAFKLIALKEFWKYGPSPRSFASREALDGAIRAKLAHRNSSVGFVSSGWVPALRAIAKVLSGGKFGGGKSFRGTKGKGRPAQEGWNPFAEIENATGMNGKHQSATSKARVEVDLTRSFQTAVGNVTEEMHDWSCREIEKALHGES